MMTTGARGPIDAMSNEFKFGALDTLGSNPDASSDWPWTLDKLLNLKFSVYL